MSDEKSDLTPGAGLMGGSDALGSGALTPPAASSDGHGSAPTWSAPAAGESAPSWGEYGVPAAAPVQHGSASTSPAGPPAQAQATQAMPTGSGPAYPPPAGGPPTSRTAPPRRSLLPAAAVIGLVSALIGGGVVLGGEQLLGSRGTTSIPAPAPGTTARPSGSIASIAANALPSVVTVKIKGTQGSGNGSGFVISKDGLVVTNHHVAVGGGSDASLTVVLNDGTALPATIVGMDTSYDLAVLKVDRTDLQPLEFGDSSAVVVGDEVIAVGAPLGLDETVTSGIISALDRPVTAGDSSSQTSYISAIQTDAAINPGNSGGPLLDMSGKVIGVNSAIAAAPGSSGSSSGNIGLGFAIPSDQARKTVNQLIKDGKATHPVIGVRVDPAFTGVGAQIATSNGIVAGGPGDKAGLKNGDVVTKLDGKPVTSADQFIVLIRKHDPGDVVTLTVTRGGASQDVKVTLDGSTD